MYKHKNQSPSQETAEGFKKLLTRGKGLVLILLGGTVVTALISYSPYDPSFSTLSSLPPYNKLGIYGSYLADLLLQAFGYGAFLIVLPLLVWGVKILINMPPKYLKLRIPTFLLGTIIGDAGLALIPLPNFLSIPSGGAIGVLLSNLVHSLIPHVGIFIPAWAWGILFYGISFLLISWSSNIALRLWGAALKYGIISLFQGTSYGLKLLREIFHLLRVRKKSKPVETMPEATSEATSFFLKKKSAKEKSKILSAPKASEPMPNPFKSSSHYKLPPVDLIPKHISAAIKISKEHLNASAERLAAVLEDFGIKGDIISMHPGPVVTLYHLRPAPGTKSSRVIGLADDIARSMSALSARIAVIPGHDAIGIELPNPTRQTVYIREMLDSSAYTKTTAHLPLILGKDIGGDPVIADLARMPHLLVAGTTGSGKSVSINTMILSLLYALPPERCRFIMIDPKMLELSVYDGIPHLLTPVVTDPHKAVMALKWVVREMETRYQSMSKVGVRNVDGYNTRIQEATKNKEKIMRRVQIGFDPGTGKPIYEEQELSLAPLPYIVVIVDEMADLMLVAGKEIESAVQRLAQMARAAGIHLIMATQRPSVDVITGTIKANFPTRISFQVTSKIDSRTILSEQGAEQLLGQGDMLYMMPGGRITRVHGPFVKDEEVEHVVQFLKSQGEPEYIEAVTAEDLSDQEFGEPGEGKGDELYNRALDLVQREGKASTSFIQRHLQIGYNRAARIIDQMEADGVISQANHVGKREVLIGRR